MKENEMEMVLVTGDEALENLTLWALIQSASERAARLANSDHPAMRALGVRAAERAARLECILAARR